MSKRVVLEVPDFSNYFNYFTEIEEHFQRSRGTGLFLLSPLDWALVEAWKNSGVPLEAVLRGIDLAFEKWRARRQRNRIINSLAYCAQEVASEAQRLADAASAEPPRPCAAPFPGAELQTFLERNAALIHQTGVAEFAPVAESLERVIRNLENLSSDLESLDRLLTVLEQRLVALARSRQSEEDALRVRQDLDFHLRPYRSRMTAPQIAMLEAQYLDRATLESAGLPRLSLFYCC